MVNNKHLSWFYNIALFFCSVMILIACSQKEVAVNDEAIRIYLFKSRNPAIASVPIRIDNADGWKSLLTVDLSQSDFVINENDLASYDWTQQTFTLTNDFKKRYEKEDYSYIIDYFVFVIGDTPVVGGYVLHPFSAMLSRIPVLENFHAVSNSEDTSMKMVLRANNIPGTLPLFPGGDAALIEKVRQRLEETGKLVESIEPQPESAASAELVVVARLVRIDDMPECGIEHVGAVAEYTDLTVLSGIYPYETIFVIHGCPELKRREYAEGSGDLESFRAGDFHELHLTRQDIYGIETRPARDQYLDERLYFCREVNLYR